MSPLWIAIGVLALMIILLEGSAWFLFRRKIEGLSFPTQCDASMFRFFTLGRMRLIATFHALFLLTIIVLCLLFLW